MIRYLTPEQVLFLHSRLIQETGGAHGVRDLSMLLSAMGRPQASFDGEDLYPDLFSRAAALLDSLIRNHPFVDGNKRMAAVACEVFLVLNGATLSAEDHELYPLYLGLSEGSLGEADFAAWLRPRIIAKAPGKVQEPSPAYRP